MKAATVYAASQMEASERERLVHAHIRHALLAVAELDCRVVDTPQTNDPLPGLAFVTPSTCVVALGLLAHIALADTRKTTLIARDLGLEEGDDSERSIERLVWSSVNTTRMVALGDAAWQSIQLLPVADRRFHDVPPLSMREADLEHPSLLVINHEATPARALDLIDALDAAGLAFKCTGLSHRGARAAQEDFWTLDASAADAWAADAWTDTASIHIHVGHHGLSTQAPRLVDSWHSGRPTIHLVDHSAALRADAASTTPAINDQEDGFLCRTPEAVIAACRDVLDDAVLRHKIVTVGRSSAAPFAEAWRVVGEELLA